MDIQEVLSELRRRGVARPAPSISERYSPENPSGLFNFVEDFWGEIDPAPFTLDQHIPIICQILQRCAVGDIQKLIINVPPGTSKTSITSVLWPAWVWTWWPECKIGVASYSKELSLRDGTRMRRLVESDSYRKEAPQSTLKDDQGAKGFFENGCGGVRYSTSVRSAVTGFHFDLRLLDDPNKPLGLDNPRADPAEIHAVNSWLSGTWATRNTDPKRTRDVVIMQRLHEIDVTGYKLSTDPSYEDPDNTRSIHMVLPMRFDPARKFVSPWCSDPRTTPGQLLAPNRMDEEAVFILEAAMPTTNVRAAQLQQLPSPDEGDIVKKTWLEHEWKTPLRDVKGRKVFFVSMDLAVSDSDKADFNVVQLYCIIEEQHVLLVDQHRFRADFMTLLDKVRSLMARPFWSAARAYVIEDKANGAPLISVLKKSGINVYPVKPSKSKEVRVLGVSDLLNSGVLKLPAKSSCLDTSWVDGFKSEALGFPNGRHDDQVDAMSQALDFARKYLTMHGLNPMRKALLLAQRRFHL